MANKTLVQAEKFLTDIGEMGEKVDQLSWKADSKEIIIALENYPGVVVGEFITFTDGSRAVLTNHGWFVR